MEGRRVSQRTTADKVVDYLNRSIRYTAKRDKKSLSQAYNDAISSVNYPSSEKEKLERKLQLRGGKRSKNEPNIERDKQMKRERRNRNAVRVLGAPESKRNVRQEGLSDWREELKEIIDINYTQAKPAPMPRKSDKKNRKPIHVKPVHNKVVVNPPIEEAIKQLGGVVLECREQDSDLAESLASVGIVLCEMRTLEPGEIEPPKENLPKQNGEIYMVNFEWRGKLMYIKLFFPEPTKPTQTQVSDALNKVYPGAEVKNFVATPLRQGGGRRKSGSFDGGDGGSRGPGEPSVYAEFGESDEGGRYFQKRLGKVNPQPTYSDVKSGKGSGFQTLAKKSPGVTPQKAKEFTSTHQRKAGVSQADTSQRTLGGSRRIVKTKSGEVKVVPADVAGSEIRKVEKQQTAAAEKQRKQQQKPIPTPQKQTARQQSATNVALAKQRGAQRRKERQAERQQQQQQEQLQLQRNALSQKIRNRRFS